MDQQGLEFGFGKIGFNVSKLSGVEIHWFPHFTFGGQSAANNPGPLKFQKLDQEFKIMLKHVNGDPVMHGNVTLWSNMETPVQKSIVKGFCRTWSIPGVFSKGQESLYGEPTSGSQFTKDPQFVNNKDEFGVSNIFTTKNASKIGGLPRSSPPQRFSSFGT